MKDPRSVFFSMILKKPNVKIDINNNFGEEL